jgi:hypothetical protein
VAFLHARKPTHSPPGVKTGRSTPHLLYTLLNFCMPLFCLLRVWLFAMGKSINLTWSPGLLANRKGPFRSISVFAIAKALSEGPEEPNKNKQCYGGRQFLKLELKFINRIQCVFSKAIISIWTSIFSINRTEAHRYPWDRHVLAPSTKQFIQPCFGANGTLFDEFGLACLHSFTRDVNCTCNIYKWHPTRANTIEKCRVQYHRGLVKGS